MLDGRLVGLRRGGDGDDADVDLKMLACLVACLLWRCAGDDARQTDVVGVG